MGVFAWFWFFKPGAVSFFNNTEEVQPHSFAVWNGVAGFRLYVSPGPMEEFDGDGSNTSADSETPVALRLRG